MVFHSGVRFPPPPTLSGEPWLRLGDLAKGDSVIASAVDLAFDLQLVTRLDRQAQLLDQAVVDTDLLVRADRDHRLAAKIGRQGEKFLFSLHQHRHPFFEGLIGDAQFRANVLSGTFTLQQFGQLFFLGRIRTDHHFGSPSMFEERSLVLPRLMMTAL